MNKKNIWHGLTLTDAATKRICHLMVEDSTMLGLRISIKKSGCVNFGYIISKVTNFDCDDYIYENNGAKLFISIKIMPFIDGTELDYVQNGLNFIFKFNNPNILNICGCGESFNFK